MPESPDTSANLALPYLQPAQAQKHVTVNEALVRLDALVQPVVLDRDRAAPPDTPAPGDRHIVAASATGAWEGGEDAIALWDGTTWRLFPPGPGWQVRCLAEAATLAWSGSAWGAVGETVSGLAELGVNAGADAVNRLSVAAPAVLFSHEGAGHQVKVNKAAAAETAALLFQTGFSGRVEMGTAGSDDFALKVSADGAAWTEALKIDAATGIATGAAVQAEAQDATPGRLLATGAFGLGGAAGQGGAASYAAIGARSGFLADAADAVPADKPQSGRGHAGLHVALTADRWIQIMGQVAAGANGEPLYFRNNHDGTVNPWRQIFHQGTLLGPVSQSGGVPTGRVIESGSNASGDYVRFADGTQICALRRLPGNAAAAVSWTYPAAFGAAPVVLGTSTNASPSSKSFVTTGYSSATSCALRCFEFDGTGAGADMNVTALGRWF